MNRRPLPVAEEAPLLVLPTAKGQGLGGQYGVLQLYGSVIVLFVENLDVLQQQHGLAVGLSTLGHLQPAFFTLGILNLLLSKVGVDDLREGHERLPGDNVHNR